MEQKRFKVQGVMEITKVEIRNNVLCVELSGENEKLLQKYFVFEIDDYIHLKNRVGEKVQIDIDHPISYTLDA